MYAVPKPGSWKRDNSLPCLTIAKGVLLHTTNHFCSYKLAYAYIIRLFLIVFGLMSKYACFVFHSTPADVARLRDSFPFCIFPDQLFAEWWDMDQNYLNELRQAPDFDASQSTALVCNDIISTHG